MVRIDYINGDSETVETVGITTCEEYDSLRDKTWKFIRAPFKYDKDSQIFIVRDHEDDSDCMMIPREFVKSIRHIEVQIRDENS